MLHVLPEHTSPRAFHMVPLEDLFSFRNVGNSCERDMRESSGWKASNEKWNPFQPLHIFPLREQQLKLITSRKRKKVKNLLEKKNFPNFLI